MIMVNNVKPLYSDGIQTAERGKLITHKFDAYEKGEHEESAGCYRIVSILLSRIFP